jgi:hypothetical protein
MILILGLVVILGLGFLLAFYYELGLIKYIMYSDLERLLLYAFLAEMSGVLYAVMRYVEKVEHSKSF